MPLHGTHAGTVEATDDPERLGRLKVRVPTVYGPVGQGAVGLADLPWALPAGLPAGGSPESGAIAWLPNIGDRVWVRFLDGEPEKPIWEWANQTTAQADNYPVWRRSPGGYTDTVAPRSAFLTRYGHSLDFQPDTFTLRTSRGYKLRFNDTEAQLDLYVPNLVGLVGRLTMTGADYAFALSGPFKLDAATVDVSANEVAVQAQNNTLTAIMVNKLDSPQVNLGPDGSATDPVVRLSDLKAAIDAVVQQFDKHKHIAISIGKPTTPPIIPMMVTPTGSSVSFTA